MGLEFLTVTSVMTALGGVANILFLISLAHTWKYWRQVKWYSIVLLVANWIEIFFRFGLYLGVTKNDNWDASDAACKFLLMMSGLGFSLALMILAALSVHVLLTGITSCQGNRLRHAVVIGLFVLLSLPVPLSKIPMSSVKSTSYHAYCAAFDFFEDPRDRQFYELGSSLATIYFPVLIFLCCGIGALVLYLSARRGPSKPAENGSDLVLLALLGAVNLVCELPYTTTQLIYEFDLHSFSSYEVLMALLYLEMTRNVLSAVVTVVFAYVHAFRNRGQGYLPPTNGSSAQGERQKLVN